MAYFAVCSDQPDVRTVERCHVNLWALKSVLPSRFRFIFDVGLAIKVPAGATSTIQLVLPFSVADGDATDISFQMRESSIARLVFGEPVTVRDAKITFHTKNGEKPDYWVGTAEPKNDKDRTSSTGNCSVWNVALTPPVDMPADGLLYVRVRFLVDVFTELCAIQSDGVLFDFRAADLRESNGGNVWAALESKLMAISHMNFFMIVPAAYKCHATSPTPKYVRLLEASFWEEYLGVKTSLFRKEKLTVYHWELNGINSSNPARVHLDVHQRRRRGGVVDMVAATTIIATAAYFLSQTGFFALLDTGFTKMQSGIAALSLSGLWAAIKFDWSSVAEYPKTLRKMKKKVDQMIF